MHLPVLIHESGGALSADELSLVQTLQCKSIDSFTDLKGCTAVWTRVVLLLPLSDASLATQLVAVTALLGLVHYAETNHAREVVVKSTDRILRAQLYRHVSHL